MSVIWQRDRRRRALVVVVISVIVLGGGALAIERPWTACPIDWSDATRIDINGASSDVVLDGRPYRVGGSALLDYMPRALISPLDRLMYGLRAPGHPLGVNASISASSREALGDPVFTCVRVTHRTEVWARRPTTYGTQTAADGYPPGAPLPARIEAWRNASVTGGPEWPTGDSIGLELWVEANGGRYVFVLQPFKLMRGG